MARPGHRDPGLVFAVRAAGINVQLHRAKVLLLSGLLAGLAGMFRYARLSDGAPTPSLLPSSAGRACPKDSETPLPKLLDDKIC